MIELEKDMLRFKVFFTPKKQILFSLISQETFLH